MTRYDIGMAKPDNLPNDTWDPERERRFLGNWFWIWPIGGALVVVQHWFNPSAFEQCPHVLFMAPLVGTATSGWTLIRTFDRRYVPQLLASVSVLCVGATCFWLSF
jgi:hypothetical protein